MSLRQYQTLAIERLRAAYRAGAKRVLLVAPTGAGKGHMLRAIVPSAKGPVVVVAPRRELVRQAHEHIGDAPAQVMTLAMLQRRDVAEPALLVVDEAHLNHDAQLTLLSRWPAARWLGMTATPCRTDGRGLGEVYQSLVEAAAPGELIAGGYLVPARAFAPATLDVTGVPRLGGDYMPGALAQAIDRPHLVADVAVTWRRLGEGRTTLVFGAGIEHSKHLAEMLGGIQLDGTSRTQGVILDRMREGRIGIVCCADLLLYGVDVPRVSCVVLARPTQSMALHLQMVGRGMRPYDGKRDLLILDHAGNCLRNGLPDEMRKWTLDGRVKRPSDAIPLRTCSQCFAVFSGVVCPCCGATNPIQARERIRTKAGELAELKQHRVVGNVSGDTLILARLIAKARTRQYGTGWVRGAFNGIRKRWPSEREVEAANAYVR